MQWIFDFQLFLFDFDGLLVNTEHLHHQAYTNVLAERGYVLDWDFAKFCQLAHQSGSVFREAIYREIPDLGPWEPLYAAKKVHYRQLLSHGLVELMPGVDPLLRVLEREQRPRVIVTNSLREDVQLIQSRIPLLRTFSHLVAREDYLEPKPHPECYRKAIALYGKPGDRVVGFEDSMRGLRALQGTPALPVLICSERDPLLPAALEGNVLHFRSFADIPSDHLRMCT